MSSWTLATIFSLPASVFVRPRGVAVRPPLTITLVRRGATVGAWSAETATAQPNLRARSRFWAICALGAIGVRLGAGRAGGVCASAGPRRRRAEVAPWARER